MGKQNPSKRKIVYRLTLSDNESHVVIRKIVFRRDRFLYISISAAIIAALLAYVLFAFTPLKHTIPGYPDSSYKKEILATAIKIDSLEVQLLRWELYAENLSKVLTGEETVDFNSVIRQADAKYLSSKNQAELAAQDSILRELVLAEDKLGFNNETTRNLPAEGLLFFKPAKGVIMEGYDRVNHPGVDIKVELGAVVSAVLDGTVIFTDREDNNGFIIMIQHKENLISIYHNNQKLLKGIGEAVKAGEPIALAGLREPYHLHFELWSNGENLDPAKYINFQ